MSGPVRVAAQDLRQFVAALFAQAGMSAVHAATVAEALVWANLRGVDTHGIARVPRYLEFIQTGIINPQPAMRVVTDTPAVLVLDADRAAGAVAMTEAADAAMTKAAAVGIGLAMVRLLMEAMGGSVQVADAPGGGADFQLRLPLARPLEAAKT